MIYLDNAATTQIDERVLEAMMPYLREQYGNPGSRHILGAEAKKAVNKAREQTARLLNCDPEQVIFTSGGTEANNLAILGAAFHPDKPIAVTSKTEHDSVLRSFERSRYNTTYLAPERDGKLNLTGLTAAVIPSHTNLVSVMYVNNETGAENPVEDIAKICHEKNALFHTDCVQAAGSHNLDTKKIDCDFLSISSHKIHGPKGAGALFVRNKELLNPMINGGSAQEFGLRGGTENVAGIVGFGRACELAKEELTSNQMYLQRLARCFWTTLREILFADELEDIMHVNGGAVIAKGRKTFSVRFDGVDGETLLYILSSKGVCVSAGSACTSHESTPSHVLTAMGIDDEDAMNSIRISFSPKTKIEDACAAAAIIADTVVFLYKQRGV